MGRPDCNAETRSSIKFGQIRKFFLDDKGYCRTVRKLPTPPTTPSDGARFYSGVPGWGGGAGSSGPPVCSGLGGRSHLRGEAEAGQGVGVCGVGGGEGRRGEVRGWRTTTWWGGPWGVGAARPSLASLHSLGKFLSSQDAQGDGVSHGRSRWG